jgi:hypothetical protein
MFSEDIGNPRTGRQKSAPRIWCVNAPQIQRIAGVAVEIQAFFDVRQMLSHQADGRSHTMSFQQLDEGAMVVCMMLLKNALGEDLVGLNAVIIGKSNIVGKPMAQLGWRIDESHLSARPPHDI